MEATDLKAGRQLKFKAGKYAKYQRCVVTRVIPFEGLHFFEVYYPDTATTKLCHPDSIRQFKPVKFEDYLYWWDKNIG